MKNRGTKERAREREREKEKKPTRRRRRGEITEENGPFW